MAIIIPGEPEPRRSPNSLITVEWVRREMEKHVRAMLDWQARRRVEELRRSMPRERA